MIIQYFEPGRHDTVFRDCMKTIPKDEYILFNSLPFKMDCGPDNAANRADLLRYWYMATHNADAIWLDSDVEVKEMFKPYKIDKPYFCATNPGALTADNWAVHGNGCSQFFLKLWAMVDIWDRKLNFGTFIYRYLATILDEYYLIPDGFYNHKSLKTWREK